MGIVELFSQRRASKIDAQGQVGDYDWGKYEQAEEPTQHSLPTGQTFSREDMDVAFNDPWEMYYTYMDAVAIPQIEEAQKSLMHLNQSIPGEMLPEPGDPVDLIVRGENSL